MAVGWGIRTPKVSGRHPSESWDPVSYAATAKALDSGFRRNDDGKSKRPASVAMSGPRGSRIGAHPCAVRDEVILTSIALVDRALVDRQGGFVHGLGQRRVRVDDARQVFGRTLELHRDHALGDQLGDARADHVHAEDAIGLGM